MFLCVLLVVFELGFSLPLPSADLKLLRSSNSNTHLTTPAPDVSAKIYSHKTAGEQAGEQKGEVVKSETNVAAVTEFDYEDFITGPTASLPLAPDNIVFGQSDTKQKFGLASCLDRQQKILVTPHSELELEIKRRIGKLTSRYQRLRSHKPLVKHQLRNKFSVLRRVLGNAGQDPTDINVRAGAVDTTRPVSLRFLRALNNVAGETSTVMGYLLAFGYLPKVMELSESRLNNLDSWDEHATPCHLEEAIGEFQKFNGLQVTRVLDYPTLRKLGKARCGLRDVPARGPLRSRRRNKANSLARPKRYVLRKRGWKTGSPKKELTYYVKNCTDTLPYKICKNEIKEGIKRWTEVAPIFIREVDESEAAAADFTLFFVSGEHPKKNLSSPKNDDPFDGPGGVVGHAYFPRGGHIHLDDAETYTYNSDVGVNLRFYVLHEMGHALGLEHSDAAATVMMPVYDLEERGSWQGSDRLQEDDIMGITRKYGQGRGHVRTLEDQLGKK